MDPRSDLFCSQSCRRQERVTYNSLIESEIEGSKYLIFEQTICSGVSLGMVQVANWGRPVVFFLWFRPEM